VLLRAATLWERTWANSGGGQVGAADASADSS
jgi:hypothetical protein